MSWTGQAPPWRERGEYRADGAVSEIFPRCRPPHQRMPLFGNPQSPGCKGKKDSSATAVGCETGANGRAGSGRRAPEGMGIGVVVQGWPCCATTPPMWPLRIGCRCVRQLGRVKARAEEGCGVSDAGGRIVKLDGGAVFMHDGGREHSRPAVWTSIRTYNPSLPGSCKQLQRRSDSSCGCSCTAGMPRIGRKGRLRLKWQPGRGGCDFGHEMTEGEPLGVNEHRFL